MMVDSGITRPSEDLDHLAFGHFAGPLPVDNFDCNRLDAPIGTVDLEVNLYMTGEGFQVEFKDTANQKMHRDSKRWADVFKDE